jgi:hypothetical protein
VGLKEGVGCAAYKRGELVRSFKEGKLLRSGEKKKAALCVMVSSSAGLRLVSFCTFVLLLYGRALSKLGETEPRAYSALKR